ncbi:hypothetical protein SEUCBS139899_003040 [Sporothrix eucalyptigena]|uniref:NADP-dependent oxidoreductase domain-containing protein n=1 Tax=Sporothrix eucalyptigena TaxID=1812306 RepID=A0ABP0CMY3_9PEZI
MVVNIVAGGAGYGNLQPFKYDEDLIKGLAVLSANGIPSIDSSQIYGSSEAILGRVKAGDSFTIHTKWGVREAYGDPTRPWATKDFILQSARESIARLGVKQVDIFYLHFPDQVTPLEDTLAGVDAAYREGLFRRFGVSNFSTEAVQAIHNIASAKGYVLPTVYQGQYNPVARHFETDLFPLLRKFCISFYAYSPLTGGLLTKTVQDFNDGKGRFAKGSPFYKMYNKPSYLASLAKWEAAAKAEGVSAAELAYRWDAHHSILSGEHGDALIVGASSLDQLGETLKWVKKGKLSDAAVAAIEEVWESVKDEGPIPM